MIPRALDQATAWTGPPFIEVGHVWKSRLGEKDCGFSFDRSAGGMQQKRCTVQDGCQQISPQDGSHAFSLLSISFLVGKLIANLQ